MAAHGSHRSWDKVVRETETEAQCFVCQEPVQSFPGESVPRITSICVLAPWERGSYFIDLSPLP